MRPSSSLYLIGPKYPSGHARIAVSECRRGVAFKRQHPFVDILLSDITESGEALDTNELMREPPRPTFQRIVAFGG
jgi:hypothetical protein